MHQQRACTCWGPLVQCSSGLASGNTNVNGFCPDGILASHTAILNGKLADFQAYYHAARSHASLEGHTPLTFTSRHTVARVELTMCVGSPTARTSFSCQWQPDNKFKTDGLDRLLWVLAISHHRPLPGTDAREGHEERQSISKHAKNQRDARRDTRLSARRMVTDPESAPTHEGHADDRPGGEGREMQRMAQARMLR